MSEQTSGIDTVLLSKLKALARRGAVLRRAPGGDGLVEHPENQSGRATRQPTHLSRSEIEAALGKGWLAERSQDEFVLSKRGIGRLRAVWSRPPASDDMRRAEATGGGHRVSEHLGAGRVCGQDLRRVRKLPEASRPGHAAHESPLAWLRRHGGKAGKEMISDVEFEAGERFRADFELAQMLPRVTASWDLATPAMRQRRSGPASGLHVSEAAVAARQRVEAALEAVGPEMAGVLIDVCCFLKGIEQAERNGGWPRRAGKVVLQLALAQLARHYGIAGRGGPSRGRILHWGAEGYRPDIVGPRDVDGAGQA